MGQKSALSGGPASVDAAPTSVTRRRQHQHFLSGTSSSATMPRTTRASEKNSGSKFFYPFSLSNPSSPSSSRHRHRSKETKTVSPPPSPPPRPPPRATTRPRRAPQPPLVSSSNILLALVAFRVLNALIVRTFFQPDEFYQSLEPAWQLAFGTEQGAWMTWVSR